MSLYYAGWANTAGVPDGEPSTQISLLYHRTFVTPWTATHDGVGYCGRLYIGDLWNRTVRNWVVLYKKDGTDYPLIGYAAIGAADTWAWTPWKYFTYPAGQDGSFETGDELLFGLAGYWSSTINGYFGRENTGGQGSYYSNATTPDDSPILTLTQTNLTTQGGFLADRLNGFMLGFLTNTAEGIVAVDGGGQVLQTMSGSKSDVIEISGVPVISLDGDRQKIVEITTATEVACTGSVFIPVTIEIWDDPVLALSGSSSRESDMEPISAPAELGVEFSRSQSTILTISKEPSVSFIGYQVSDHVVTISGVPQISLFGGFLGASVVTGVVSLVGEALSQVELLGGIPVTASRQNFTMHRGDSKRIMITIPDYPLGGSSITFQLAESVAGVPLVEKTIDNGVSLDIGTDGVCYIDLYPEDTYALSGKYYFEVEVTDTDGDVATVTTGTVQLLPTLIT